MILGACGDEERVFGDFCGVNGLIWLMCVIGKTSFFPAEHIGELVFPGAPTSEWSEIREVPALGEMGQQEIGGRSRGLADCESWVCSFIDQDYRATLGRKYPCK